MTDISNISRRLAQGCYFLLIFTVVVWESWGAPSPSSPFYTGLILKTVPLLIMLPGILTGNMRSYLLASLLLLLYFTEGVVLTYGNRHNAWDHHSELSYALLEVMLTSLFIAAGGVYVRLAGR